MKKVMKSFTLIVYVLMVAYTIPASSQETYKFELAWGSRGSGDGQFNNPVGVAVDPSGDVYVADVADSYNDNRIQRFDSNGNFKIRWILTPSYFYPQGMTTDLSGNVYVITNGHRIQKFDSNGNFITTWDIQLDCHCLGGIALDSLGNLYATTYYCCIPIWPRPPGPVPTDIFDIRKFDSNGNLIAKWGSDGTGDGQFLGYPEGVAVDSSGYVYVVDPGNNRIQKFDSNGNFISKWGTQGAEDSQFSAPYGVAVDSAGNVYVSDKGNDRIQKFDSAGNFITKWGYLGQAAGQFDGPEAIAVDSSGDVYVADTGNYRIQKFSQGGQEPASLPDLTGQWDSLIQRCRNTRIGPKCVISGRLNIQNIGNQDAPSSFVRFYLSNDAYIDGADIFLKQVATGSVRMGTSKAKMLRYSFPFGETASGKYIIAVIDADNAVTESNKSNNYVVFGPIQ